MNESEFIARVFEIAFGDDAVNENYTKEQVLTQLSALSGLAWSAEQEKENGKE